MCNETVNRFKIKQREGNRSMKGRLLSLAFTCKMCTKLGYFTDSYMADPQIRNACPKVTDKRNRQLANGVLSTKEEIHAFRVCCAAFGVGQWDTFKAVCPLLSGYTNGALEFQAHVELGVWDITPFVGIHLWPPRVKPQLAQLHSKSLQQDDTILQLLNYDWNDPLTRLFVDPVRFRYEWDSDFYHDDFEQRIWMANYVEFSIDAQDIASAKIEMKINPFAELMQQMRDKNFEYPLDDSVTDYFKSPQVRLRNTVFQ